MKRKACVYCKRKDSNHWQGCPALHKASAAHPVIQAVNPHKK